MQRDEERDEYETLIQAAGRMELLPKIDVTQRVMEQISGEKPGQKRLAWKLLLSPAGAVAGLLTLMLISVTAYAASEYIQIRNAAGEIKVQYAAPEHQPEPAGSNSFEQQALKKAEPGELIAYYVKETPNRPDSEKGGQLQFAHLEKRWRSYSEFLKEIKRTGAPQLPKSVAGYTLEYGTVSPNYPTSQQLKTSPYYQRVLDELKTEAKKAKGQRVFSRAVPWTEAASVYGVYTQGAAHIGLSANLLHGGDMTVLQEPENRTESHQVEGRTVIYNDVDRTEVSYHYLSWYNEKQDAYYMFTTYGSHELSKEDLIHLAGELIQGGL